MLFSLDVLFARVLTRNSAIWWYDELRKEEVAQLMTGEHSGLEINNPGFYNCTVIEADVNLLPINALYFMDKFCDDLETGRLVEKVRRAGPAPEPDSLDSVRLAFKFLCHMARQLLDDADKKYSTPADLAVQNLSRWISDPNRPFHDPLLQKAVSKVIKRCFMEFLHRLQQMGVQVIQADIYKLVFTSGHMTVQDAGIQFTRMFEDSLQRQDEFRFVYCRISSVRQCHLQYEYANCCGLDQHGEYYSSFDLLKPLPPKIQNQVKGFLLQYCEQMLRIRQAHNPLLKNYRDTFRQAALAYLHSEFEHHVFTVLEWLSFEYEKFEQL